MKTITVDPGLMSGAPVFTGTRVPIQNLFDYLQTGETVNTFLEDFPSVRPEQVNNLLEISAKQLQTH